MTSFDKKRVEEVFTKGKREQWPYPEIFNALKDAGVENYETDVATRSIVYHGSGDACTEPPPAGFISLTPNPHFDPAGVQLAVQRNQSKQTDYSDFLREIAQADVNKYRVDVNARTVMYIGASGQEYVEKVPQF